jgi:hypothetical protein
MALKRQSLKLDDVDWQVVMGIARECGCEYRGEPSWRRLFDEIASGKLTVVNRPDKRVRAFQEKLRRPIWEQRQKQFRENCEARAERDRLRQEEIRRAAGIPPSGAQEALDEATGCPDVEWPNDITQMGPDRPAHLPGAEHRTGGSGQHPGAQHIKSSEN